MASEAPPALVARDSPSFFGIFFSGVAGPLKAPCRICCKRCLVSVVSRSSFLFMAKDTPKSTRPPRAPKLPPTPLRPDQNLRPVGLIQLKLIGRVVVEWARLENCLNDLIMRYTGLEFETGRLFTEKMDPVRSIALLRILGPRNLEGAALQDLINALATADQLRDDRNFIVHGTWATITPEGHPTASSVRAKSPPGEIVAEHFPHVRMKTIIREITKTRATCKIAVAR